MIETEIVNNQSDFFNVVVVVNTSRIVVGFVHTYVIDIINLDVVLIMCGFVSLMSLPLAVELVESVEVFDLFLGHFLGLEEVVFRSLLALLLLFSTSADEISTVHGVVSTVFAVSAPLFSALVLLLAWDPSAFLALFACLLGESCCNTPVYRVYETATNTYNGSLLRALYELY